MKLTLTSWSFPACSLKEVVGISKVLGINALDLGYFYTPALDKAAILQQPEKEAEKVLALNIKIPCLYHLFGNSLADRNLADSTHRKSNIADFQKIVCFCKLANIDVIFVLPGIVNPKQNRQQALEQSIESLKPMLAIAKEHGIILTIEPHVHSYLESPSITQELLEKVPGLKLTLDYSHFVCLGYRQEEIDPLVKSAAHIHLRQGKSGFLQVKKDAGTINIEAQFGTLANANYQGYIALEYAHQDYMEMLYEDVLTETITLRDSFYRWIKK